MDSGLDAAAIVAIVAAAIALVAMGVTIWQASEARKSRQATERQAGAAEQALVHAETQAEAAKDSATSAMLSVNAAEKAANAAEDQVIEARRAANAAEEQAAQARKQVEIASQQLEADQGHREVQSVISQIEASYELVRSARNLGETAFRALNTFANYSRLRIRSEWLIDDPYLEAYDAWERRVLDFSTNPVLHAGLVMALETFTQTHVKLDKMLRNLVAKGWDDALRDGDLSLEEAFELGTNLRAHARDLEDSFSRFASDRVRELPVIPPWAHPESESS